MKKLYDLYLENIIDSLEDDATRILKECVDERTYEHQTMNLYDSYGYGIYVNKQLKRIGFLFSSPQATTAKMWYGKKIRGREAIQDFLKNEYTPTGYIELAIAAAMPYANILEEGKGLKHKYKVISMSFQKLKEIQKKYNAKVRTIK